MSNKKNSNRIPSELDVQRVLQLSTEHLMQYKFAEACKVTEDILKDYPNCTELLEMRANIAMEMSDKETALQYLNKVITISPFSRYSNFLSKAQLLKGKDSLCCYERAIQIIKVELSKLGNTVAQDDSMECDDSALNSNDSRASVLNKDLSSVYCCIAELYFTDLCDEPDAEDVVKQSLDRAFLADSSNVEAYITKVRYLVIIKDYEAAQQLLESSRSLWRAPEEGRLNDAKNLEDVPSSLKMNISKALIELAMYSDAIKMLNYLLLEDDQVHREFPTDDQGIVSHIKELLQEIKSKGEENNDGSDDEWESEDDDDVDDETLEREIIDQAERAEEEDH